MTYARVTIDDATSLIIDHRGKTPKKLGAEWTTAGHRVISALNIKGSRIDENDHHYVDSRTYANWMKVPLAAGDTLLTSEAPLGEVAYLQHDVDWVLGQRLYALRTKPSLAVGRFLFYALQSPLVRNDLEARATGTTVFGISQVELRKVQIPCPPIAEQQRIAEMLGALDDKIESNRRTAVKCYEVANELFHQAASVNRKLDEVSEVRMGVSPPGSSYNETGEGMAFFQGVRDFSFLHPVARVYTNEPKRLAAPGDILFSVRAPVGRLNIADSPCCIGRGLAAITSNRSAICLFALRAAAAEWEKFSAEGTVFGAVNQKSLKSTFIPWPNPLAEQELENQLSLLIAIASQSERESISISKLRDALLPELMSGRMRVDEAGRLVTEALDEEVADV